MIVKAPKIDNRSGEQIFHALEQQFRERLGIGVDGDDPLAKALLRVFSRYCEVIIERLNKVPDKNHDVFLDLLNMSRIPPVSAVVPLTFTPVQLPAKSAPVYVPARTKVAAQPGAGESEPVIFETTRDLALTNIELRKVLALDPVADLYSDKSFLATPKGGAAEFAFQAREPLAHEFYLGHDPIFGRAEISELRLNFEIEAAPSSGQKSIQWLIPTKDGELALNPAEDTTGNLSRSGVVVFKNLPDWEPHQMFGKTDRWLGCRLPDRLTPQTARTGKVMISASWDMKKGVVDRALFNSMPLDLSKDFFPLGINPRFGDVFYLKAGVFSNPGTHIIIRIKLTNPASAKEESPIPPTSRIGEPRILWERYNGQIWIPMECRDGTDALTEDGDVSFTIQSPFTPTSINGDEGCWIRARLVSGNYGETRTDTGIVLATPPSIQSIAVVSTCTAGPERPGQVITNNNFSFEEVDASACFPLFKAATEPCPALYLGFKTPGNGGSDQARLPLDIYVHTGEPEERACIRTGAVSQPPALVWHYWNGKDWALAKADDETGSFASSGIITLHSGDDIAPWREYSLDKDEYLLDKGLHWFRAQWTGDRHEYMPRLRRLLLNTVQAEQTVTLENELLGASNGRPNQTLHSARVPVLQNVQLEVREPDTPPAAELERICREEGKNAVTVSRDPSGNIEQIWVRWHEVTDFLSSINNDRHFTVNRENGEIRFGDGIKGLIPPAGPNNVRLRRYHTGGGASGNKPARSIAQLRATVPYVDSVTNLEPALGGQDMKNWGSLRKRGARWLRHRDYAVTVEDYEDLAKMASPNVAKARCYPNVDLSADPAGTSKLPGIVSIIAVPNAKEPGPLPDMTLLRRVRDFLKERKAPDAELVILAPEYVRISVDAVVVPTAPHRSAEIIAQCEQKLECFFHPVTGDTGRGWDFGRVPHESDIYALLESIEDLDFVRSLSMVMTEERPGLLGSGIFLIRSGEHRVRPGA